MTVTLALLAAGFIGVSDFLGAAASRTRSAITVSAVLQLAGLVTLTPIALVMGASDLTRHDVALGAASGLVTSVAFIGFFTAMAHGRMGIVVPVSAALAALLPAIVGIAGGNSLSTLAVAGVACALVAIPLVAYEPDEDEDVDEDGMGAAVVAHGGRERRELWSTRRQLGVSVLCGSGFGIYFVCIGHTSRSAGLWPTVANLVVALAVTIPIAVRGGAMPSLASAPRAALAGGVALGAADACLTTALQQGPLTVASVLGNLYPLVTIALGVTLLGERVHPWHALGIVLAVAGVAMIAAG
jgi:drug/metabolite transporter (DMT)-like permease